MTSRIIICVRPACQAWGDAAFPTRYFVSYNNAFAFGWRFEAASGGQ
jgi:hypothetical protein